MVRKFRHLTCDVSTQTYTEWCAELALVHKLMDLPAKKMTPINRICHVQYFFHNGNLSSFQLVGVYKDPEGTTVFGDHTTQEPGVQPSTTTAQSNTFESGSVKSLQMKILKLEEELLQAKATAS